MISLLFGMLYGGYQWANAVASGLPTSAGTVMLAALPVFTGIQFLLAFVNYDVATVPARAVHPSLSSHVIKVDAIVRN